jgi:glyoxylase-like metal-dependent hydrolase (beta-lactamase superfamily II)
MTAVRPTVGAWSAPTEDLLGAAVAPGVWVASLGFPSPLRFSFSYVLETVGDLVVVDLGWNDDDAWSRFLLGLARAGKALDDVAGVVVTHAHPDHYGLAGRIREYSDAWLAMHPGELPQLAADEPAVLRRLEDLARWLSQCGAPDEELDGLRAESAELIAHFPRLAPDVELVDGVPVPGTGGSLVPLHTPGHTPGSLCFLDRAKDLVFTGDHVLPRVTPNVSKRPTSDDDPLQDYLRSLRRLRGPDGERPLLALPGHEWGFGELGDRVTEIDLHHQDRLQEIREAVQQGSSTVWGVAQVVHWSRPFGTLAPRARRSALGETHSHLYRLWQSGQLRLVEGTPDRWTPAV